MTTRFCPTCPVHAHLFESDGRSILEADKLRRENVALKKRLEIVLRAAKQFRALAQERAAVEVVH